MPKNYGITSSQECEDNPTQNRLVVALATQANNGNIAVLGGSVTSICDQDPNEVTETFRIVVDGVEAYVGPSVPDEIITIPSGAFQGVQFRFQASPSIPDRYSPTITVISGLPSPMPMGVTLTGQDSCGSSDSKTVSLTFDFTGPISTFLIEDNEDGTFRFDGSLSTANGCPSGITAYLWEFPDMVEGTDYEYINATDSSTVITEIRIFETSTVGIFTIRLTVTTDCGTNTSEATSDKEGGGGDCDDVLFPFPSQMATTPEAEVSNGTVTFTWENLTDGGALLAPTIAASGITPNSTVISWSSIAGVLSYSIRYRLVGAGTWTQIDNITGTTTTLTGLVANQQYEAQGQSTYPGNQMSSWGNTATWTTNNQTTSTEGLQFGFNGWLDTPINTYTSEDNAIASGLVRIYANFINSTKNSSNGSDPAFNPSDGFSGQNQDAYLESLAAAGHGIIYVPEGAPWYIDDTPVSKRVTNFVMHGLPADDANAIYNNGEQMVVKSNYSQIALNYAIMAARWGDPTGAVHGITDPNTGLLANVRGSKGPVDQNIFRNGGGLQLYNEIYEHWEGEDFTYTLPSAMASALGLPGSETRKGGDIPPEAHAAIMHAISDAVGGVNTKMQVYASSDVYFDPQQHRRWKWYWDTFNGGIIPQNIRYAIHYYHHTGGANDSNYKKLIDFGARPISPDDGGSVYSSAEDHYRTAIGIIEGSGITRDRTGIYEFGRDQDDRPWNGFNNGGPNVVDPIGSMDKVDVNSSWTLRDIIHGARAGLHEFTYYAIRDAQQGTTPGNRQGSLFGTSGARFGNYEVTKMWYHYMLLVRRLQGSNYVSSVNASDGNVAVDKFETDTQVIYTIFRTSASDQTSSNVTFDVGAGESNPVRYVRSDTNSQGVSSTPSLAGSTVTVPSVDEHVQYIVLSK